MSDEPSGTGPLARRGASVTLAPGGGTSDSTAMMDPAHQSLADALRITYRLVQLATIVLGVLYVLSGFQSIKENEQGIRLIFGRKDAERLDPGLRFSYPAPIGEMVRVDTGAVKVELVRDSDPKTSPDRADFMDFWVHYADDKARQTPIEQLNKPSSLNPEREGSVITSDGNLAHTRWSLSYTRDPNQVGKYAQHVLPEAERDIVFATVKRGVVYALSQVTIDDLLKQSSGEGGIAGKAKDYAQAALDRLSTGIRIDQLKLEDKIPPLNVRDKFAAVQSAEANAGKAREEAASQANQALNAVAGAAAEPLLALIDQYELALAKKDEPTKAALLRAIYAAVEGEAIDLDGVALGKGAASGEVTKIISEARQYRSSVVNERRSDAAVFLAKLEQFKSNPLVMIHTEWQDAYAAFSSRNTVENIFLPAGLQTLELTINADPEFVKEIEKAIQLRQGERAAAERAAKQAASRFNVETGLKALPD